MAAAGATVQGAGFAQSLRPNGGQQPAFRWLAVLEGFSPTRKNKMGQKKNVFKIIFFKLTAQKPNGNMNSI